MLFITSIPLDLKSLQKEPAPVLDRHWLSLNWWWLSSHRMGVYPYSSTWNLADGNILSPKLTAEWRAGCLPSFAHLLRWWWKEFPDSHTRTILNVILQRVCFFQEGQYHLIAPQRNTRTVLVVPYSRTAYACVSKALVQWMPSFASKIRRPVHSTARNDTAL